MQPNKYIVGLLIQIFLWPFLITAQGLRIPAGAYVIANQGNIVLKNKWINNGTFTPNGGTVVFAGSTQQISGTKATLFNNLLVSAGSTTTIISTGNALRKILKSNGTLTAGNNFTLLSSATQTALVDGTGIGNVFGIITMQGYLANGFGYKYLGSPFQLAKVSEMSDDVNLMATFASVYRFDESLTSNGWVTYTDSTNILTPMRGFAFQLGNTNAARTIDINGVVNNGNLSLALVNNNRTFTKGFHLISNPYPSPINWDATSGWTKSNIDNAIYYFDAGSTDQYAGSYNSVINGISSDGKATAIIPAMQGFFVHVSTGTYPVSGTLSIGNATRMTNMATTYRHLNGLNDSPLLRLRLSFKGNTESDPVVIYFESTATEKFDKYLDALKLMNTAVGIPSLYVLNSAVEKLSIKSLAEPNSTTVIPLGIQLLKEGDVSFFSSDIAALPTNLYSYLYDSVTKKYLDLTEMKSYDCYLPAGVYEKRFAIVFSRNPIMQQQAPVDNISATSAFNVSGAGRNIFITLLIPTGEKAIIRIINTTGQVLSTKTYTSSGTFPLDHVLAQGIYHMACYIGDTVITKQIFVSQ